MTLVDRRERALYTVGLPASYVADVDALRLPTWEELDEQVIHLRPAPSSS